MSLVLRWCGRGAAPASLAAIALARVALVRAILVHITPAHIVLVAIAGIAGVAHASAPITFPEADERLYLQRFEALQSAMRLGSGPERYDPLVPVAGVRHYVPFPVASAAQRTIADEALAAARDYAAANASDAIIVWRGGRIETEAYFGGHTRETPIVSRSLAKPMTAAAIGRAIALRRIDSLDQPAARTNASSPTKC